jgi:hypothetical protein
MSTTIMVKVDLADDFLDDVRVTATEGGIGYWANVVDYTWREPDGRTVVVTHDPDDMADLHVAALASYYANGCAGVVIDRAAIARGIAALLDGSVPVGKYLLDMISTGVREGDAGEIDSDGADVIVQAAIFGKIIFG